MSGYNKYNRCLGKLHCFEIFLAKIVITYSIRTFFQKSVLLIQLLRCVCLCDLMNCSPPGCSVHGISQARILEWVANSSFRGSSWHRDWTCVFCIAGRFFITEPPGKPLLLLLIIIIIRKRRRRGRKEEGKKEEREWVRKEGPTLHGPWHTTFLIR